MIVKILKSFPLSIGSDNTDNLIPYLNDLCVRKIYQGLNMALINKNMEVVSLSIDIFSAFVSDLPDYMLEFDIFEDLLGEYFFFSVMFINEFYDTI